MVLVKISSSSHDINKIQKSIIEKISAFYQDDKNTKSLLNLLMHNSTSDIPYIPVRLVDWFVTKYCKTHQVAYKLENQFINIYASYKSNLKGYQKRHFDPFCRGIRIKFEYETTKDNFSSFITTIGQLNFFKWFIHYKIFDYMLENRKKIEEAFEKEPTKEPVKEPIKVIEDKISAEITKNTNQVIKVKVTFD